ncbi:Putative Nucleoside-diphosphate-sugar epimerase(NAD(P)-binding domain,2-207) [Magnetospirillum sp. XM-1]|nr:Putative Nucleoside-diphosphate-sugar epimerase(NAD(P)-binding domain,2-207) [Magnetospirillum sp. XM-1]
MNRTRIVVTGGAGFVGSNIAMALKRDMGDAEVVAFDNLKRRGSELTLTRLRQGGVGFEHGDVRCAEDLAALGPADLVIECSAEPSVHAGYDGNPAYVVNTNLLGTVNCLEYARRSGAAMVFLSTSRVYPIASLRAIPLEERGERLVIPPGAHGPGWSEAGITADFPLSGSRSIYGATKLASELLIEEYRALYGLKAVINRCGVLTGPWQMGKVDQGVIVLWMARHVFGGPLGYMGFGGHGRQVRDILHVDDLYDLVRLQMADMERFSQGVFNVGGGPGVSVSLRELTGHCRRISGREVALGSAPQTRDADVPYYVTDNAAITEASGWTPRRDVETVLGDIHAWLLDHRAMLAPMFA